MQCPGCGYRNTKVVDTMSGLDGRSVYRRRKCPSCAYRFRTVETLGDGSDEFKKAYTAALENKSRTFKSTNDRRRARGATKKNV